MTEWFGFTDEERKWVVEGGWYIPKDLQEKNPKKKMEDMFPPSCVVKNTKYGDMTGMMIHIPVNYWGGR